MPMELPLDALKMVLWTRARAGEQVSGSFSRATRMATNVVSLLRKAAGRSRHRPNKHGR